MPSLVIIPTQGFCNRLRIIASAHILSSFLNIDMFLIWEKEDCCNCEYSDIFLNSYNSIDFKTISDSKYLFSPNTHTNNLIHLIDDYDYVVVKGGHEFKHPDMSIVYFLQMKHAFYKRLSFTNQLNTMINNVNPTGYIGIHYRDFIPKYDSLDGRDFSKQSPLEDFINVIKKIYTKDNSSKFFISSNTDTALEEISKFIPSENILQLGDKDLTLTKNRDTTLGIIHAVVSLVLLSKCKFIVGTLMSSFSDEACFFNNISKLCVGNELIDSYHCHGFHDIMGHKMLLPDFNILYDIYKEDG
jgi:hypothetical protein